MPRWHRVFGTNDVLPEPAAVLEFLHAQGLEISGKFHGDDLGWFRAALQVQGTPWSLERYLTAEDDIRDDLNTWAAWLESQPAGRHQDRLMQHMISTRQLLTLQAPEPAEQAAALCRFISQTMDGVYQIDSEGFFAADGTLLVSEGP